MKLDHTLKRLGGLLRDRSSDLVAAELPPHVESLLKQLDAARSDAEQPPHPPPQNSPQETRR